MNFRSIVFVVASFVLSTCGKRGGGGGDPAGPNPTPNESPNSSSTGRKTQKELKFNFPLADVKGEGSTIYAATSFGGLYISRDYGVTWVVKGEKEGLMNSGLAGLQISGQKVYLLSSRALSVSSDKGNSWVKRDLPDNVMDPSNKGAFYVDSGSVYMIVEHGLAISSDDGATWTVKKSPEVYYFDTGLNSVYANGVNVYVATNSGLMVSDDRGQTWTEKTEIDFGPKMTKTGLSAVWGDGKTVYAAADNLYVSTDAGKTWAYKSTIPHSSWARDVRVVEGKLYASGDGIASSADLGETWETAGLVDSDGSFCLVEELHILGATMYAVPRDCPGFYRTSDSGKTWEAL